VSSLIVGLQLQKAKWSAADSVKRSWVSAGVLEPASVAVTGITLPCCHLPASVDPSKLRQKLAAAAE
jgi:hypothetical protein